MCGKGCHKTDYVGPPPKNNINKKDSYYRGAPAPRGLGAAARVPSTAVEHVSAGAELDLGRRAARRGADTATRGAGRGLLPPGRRPACRVRLVPEGPACRPPLQPRLARGFLTPVDVHAVHRRGTCLKKNRYGCLPPVPSLPPCSPAAVWPVYRSFRLLLVS